MPILDLPSVEPSGLLCSPWLTVDDLPAACADADPSAAEGAILVASEVLYHLSGQQFAGVCSTTSEVGAHDHGCVCGTREATVLLGGFPVVDVAAVAIDGEPLVAGVDFQLVDRRYLRRLAGRSWPCSGIVVTFSWGRQPTAMGVRAAGALACELLALDSGGDCRLPERVTSVTRQGVSAIILDPMAFLDKGKTGLYVVDLFLSAVNPGRLMRAATVTTTKSRRRAPRHVS